jgi:hypothetical protein
MIGVALPKALVDAENPEKLADMAAAEAAAAVALTI